MSTTLAQVEKKVLTRFSLLLKKQRLAHAYLFVGPSGVGKLATALAVAKLVNCEANEAATLEEPCGQCATCRKIEAGQHPDVTLINSGEEDSIKIAAIRELIARIQLKPYEARKKIFILQDVEKLTLESANALLKTLEEPSNNSLLLLTTSSAEQLLGTVRSRCQPVLFFSSSAEKLAALLTPELGAAEAQFLSAFTEGCAGRAQDLAQEKFFIHKNQLIDQIVLSRASEAVLKELWADKVATKTALAVMLSWFRDLLLVKEHVGTAQLVHSDRIKEVERSAGRYSFGQILAIIAAVEDTLRMLDENLNVKVSFYLILEKIWAKA